MTTELNKDEKSSKKKSINDLIERTGKRMASTVENFGLLFILFITIIAIFQEVLFMLEQRKVHLSDLLLMFIYLEVVAMVAAFWRSGHLPVRMPIYISIVALARYLTLDMKEMDEWRIFAIALAVCALSLAVLIIRYGHIRFPYGDGEGIFHHDEEEDEDKPKSQLSERRSQE